MLSKNFSTVREISDLRLQLRDLDPKLKSKKLAKYIEIFEKSSLLADYSLKLDDITQIVKLALELKEFETVHEYCNKAYEDISIDKLIFYKFQGQAYDAQENFQSAFATFNKASKIYDNDEVWSSLAIVLKKIEKNFKGGEGVFYQLCVQGGSVINAQSEMNDYVDARIRLNEKNKSKESKPTSPNSYESPSSSSQPLQKYRPDQIQSIKSTPQRLFTSSELSITPELSTPQRLFTPPVLSTPPELSTPQQLLVIQESSSSIVEGDFVFSDFPAQGNQQIPNHHQASDASGVVRLVKEQFELMINEGIKNQLAKTKEENVNSLRKMIEELEESQKKANNEERKEIEKKILELRNQLSIALEEQGKMKITQDEMKIRQDVFEAQQHSIKARVKTLEDKIENIGKIITIEEILGIFRSQFQKSDAKKSEFSQDSSVIEDPAKKRNKDRDEFYEKKIEEIHKTELYRNYYCSLVSELNSLYLVAMVVKNDLIKTNESEKYQKIAAYMKVLYNFIPVVGPLVEGVVDVVALTRDKCKDILSKEKMLRFAELAEGVGEFEQISLRLAINLMDYKEIMRRASDANSLLDGAKVRDAAISRVDEQVALLGDDNEEEIATCSSNCFKSARNIYFDNSQNIVTMLGKLDAIKIIDFIQERGFVKNIIAESQVKKSTGDIRRVKSIIAESIVEKFKKSNTPDLTLDLRPRRIQFYDQEVSSQTPETIIYNDRSNQEKVGCLNSIKKSITRCLGVQ